MKRGFGSLKYGKDRQRQVASMGGFMAQLSGKAHRWNSEGAKLASRKSVLVRYKIYNYVKRIDPYIAFILKLRESD